jgi:4'-phosphopantetheinyl transferase
LNGDTLAAPFRPFEECRFAVNSGEIHLWRVDLDVADARQRKLEKLLSEDEQARAARFLFPRDRARFITCRGVLRELLARYLGEDPRGLRFGYAPHGKPALKAAGTPLHFNVSHSQSLALIAIRGDGEVGVDVEQLRAIEEAEAIARRYFAPREHATIRDLTGDERIAAFFRCWTRKEAMLKATGEGIANLDAVEVAVRSEDPIRVLAIRGSSAEEVARWRLDHVEPGAGFVGAIASPQGAQRVTAWQGSDMS